MDKDEVYQIKKWCGEVIHLGKRLSEAELEAVLNVLNGEYVYEHNVFSSAMNCLALGSDYILKNTDYLAKFFDIPLYNYDLGALYDYDLGALYDAVGYSATTKKYGSYLMSAISYEHYLNDWDYSCISAINTLSKHVRIYKDNEIYLFLKNKFEEALLKFNALDETDKTSEANALIAYLDTLYSGLKDTVWERNFSSLPNNKKDMNDLFEADRFKGFPEKVPEELKEKR